VVRELQKEVKQLYNELNEKNQQFDALQEEVTRLKSTEQSVENGRLQIQKQQDEEDRRSEFSYKEEIASLKQKLDASLNEADDLRLQVSRNEKSGKSNGVKSAHSPSSDVHGIADPAEAEYLRNVLYRYMTNRESLGKESVVSEFIFYMSNYILKSDRQKKCFAKKKQETILSSSFTKKRKLLSFR
uniref:GRIP domain-containing protein n=1 Tax=Caenorhabditis japonica TaxID=281687 RepID=A0A8R1IQA3_CAEJA